MYIIGIIKQCKLLQFLAGLFYFVSFNIHKKSRETYQTKQCSKIKNSPTIDHRSILYRVFTETDITKTPKIYYIHNHLRSKKKVNNLNHGNRYLALALFYKLFSR